MKTFRKFIISVLTSFILVTGVCYASPQRINADEELDEFFPEDAYKFLLSLDPSSDCGLVKVFSTGKQLLTGITGIYNVYSLVSSILSAVGVFKDPEAEFRQQVKEKLDRITLQVDTINSRLTSVESTLIDQFAEAGLQTKALHAKELANQNTSFVNNIVNVMDGYMRPMQDSISISLDAYVDAIYSGDFDVVQDINIVLNSKAQSEGSTYVKNIAETMTIPASKIRKAIDVTKRQATTKQTIEAIFREFYHQEFNEKSYCYYLFCPLYNWQARKYVVNNTYPLIENVGHEPSVQKFFKEAYTKNGLTGNMQDLENEFVELCYEGMCNFFTKEYFSEGEGTRKSMLGRIDTVFNNYYKAITTSSDSPIEREYSIIKDTYAFQGDLIYSYDQYVENNTYEILSQSEYNKLSNEEKENYTKETVNVNQIKDIHDYYYTLTAVYATFTIAAYKACDQLNQDTLTSLMNKWKEMNRTIDSSFDSMAKRYSNGDYAMNYCYLSDSLVDFKTISSKASLRINYHEGGLFKNLDAYDSTEKSDWSKEYTNNDIVTTTNLKQLYAMCNANGYGSDFKAYLNSRNIKFTSDTNLLIGSEIQSRGISDGNLNQHVYSWCVLASDWFEDYKYTTLSGNGHGIDGLDSSYRLGAFADAMNVQNGAVESSKLLASAAAFHQSRTSANDAMCIFYPGELEGKKVASNVCGSTSSSSNSYISVAMNIGNQYGALFKVNESKNNLLLSANPFTPSQYDKQDEFHISLIDKINKNRKQDDYVSYYYDETIGSIPYWINIDEKYLDNTSEVNDRILNQVTDYLLDNVNTIASEYNDLEATYKANTTFKDELLKVDLTSDEVNRIAKAVIYDYVDEVVNEYSDLPKPGDENKYYYCVSNKIVYGYDGNEYKEIAKLGEDKLMCYYDAKSTLETKDDEVVFIKECATKNDIGNDPTLAYYCLQDHRIYSHNKKDITSKVNNIDNTKTNKNQLECPDITKTYYNSNKFYRINLTGKTESVFEEISNVEDVERVEELPTLTSDKYYYVSDSGRLYHKSYNGLSYEIVNYEETNEEIIEIQVDNFYKFNETIYYILENGSFIEITPSSVLPNLDITKIIEVYGNRYIYDGSVWKTINLITSEIEPINPPEDELDGYIYDGKAYLWNEDKYITTDYAKIEDAYLYIKDGEYYVLDYVGLKKIDIETYNNTYTNYIIKLNGDYYRYTDANTKNVVKTSLPILCEQGKIVRGYDLINDNYNFYIYSNDYNLLDYETIFNVNALPKPNNADKTHLINNELKIWNITEYIDDTRYIVGDLPESFDATKTYIIGNTLYTYDFVSSYVPDSVADLTYANKEFNFFENNARKVEGIIYKVGDVYYSYYKNLDEFVPYGMIDFGTIEELPIVDKDSDLALMYKLDFHLMIDINIDDDGNITHESKPVFDIYPLLTWTDNQSNKHEFEVIDSELLQANVTCNVKVPIVKDDNTSNTAATNHYVSMLAGDIDRLKERLVSPIKGSKNNRYTEVKVKTFSPFMISKISKLLPYTLPKTGVETNK